MRATDKKPNRLIHETSPYLLQHAHNPVDWFPWGEEAFAAARTGDRPIFLSVGYSSCHWCHVMERESFDDEEVARILNERFVPVKVDREERPDVDGIYMTAVQMLTGQGGWPMSVFLTPDLKPFFAGTYFPPEGMYGRPGFKDLLFRLSELWREQREKVLEVAANVGRVLQAEGAPAGVESARGTNPPGSEVFRSAFDHADRSFDEVHGGFGGAPKFPRSVDLSQLLLHHHATGDRRALEMVDRTLRKMAEGGIYDHLGGGFHRYSTDAAWLVPHFEKMLYDNALLARTYTEGWQVTGDRFFARIARETLDYLLREMAAPEGGYYSATDADSSGFEGSFFVWTPEEVAAAIGRDRAEPFCFRHGILAGGNFEGRSVLHGARTVEETAARFGASVPEMEQLLEEARRALLAERARREPPFRDEKVIAAWNGLALSAFARAHTAFREPRFLEAAIRTGDFVRDRLIVDGTLHRIWKDGRVRFPGYLDDHAYLVEGLLDLYEASFDPSWIDLARTLAARMVEDFWDAGEGGFFFSAERHRDLIARRKDPFDGATPAGNGVAALDLLRLSALTGERSWRDRAAFLFSSLQKAIVSVPMGFGSTLIALDLYHRPATEIAVAGGEGTPERECMLAAIGRRFIPRRVLAGTAGPLDAAVARKIPLLEGKDGAGARPAVSICRNYACERPVTSPEELETRLDALARPGGA